MTLRPNPLRFFPLRRTGARPHLWWHRILRHRVNAELCSAEGLHEARKHEPGFVVCELLTEADARASVEGEEDEGVWSQVGGDALVEESRRVENVCVWSPEVLTSVHDEDGVDDSDERECAEMRI